MSAGSTGTRQGLGVAEVTTTVPGTGNGRAGQDVVVDVRDGSRVAAVAAALTDLRALVASLSADEVQRATGCPGWTVFDVVAHCVSLESLLAGEPHPDHDLEVEPAHVHDDTGRFMEVLVDAWRDRTFADLAADLGRVFDARQHQLSRLSDLSGELQGFAGPMPARSLVGMRTFDLWIHEQDIRRAVRRPGGMQTEPAAVVARRMRRGLEAVLPQRIDRGCLELTVTGDKTWRSSIHCGDGDTVRVSIPFAALVPIVAGRDDAPDPATAARIDGDLHLAACMLTNLVITP